MPTAQVAPLTKTAGKPLGRPGIPRLMDLGSDKCVPCKMMAPVLEDLRRRHRGKLTVEFIDVWKNRDAAQQYHIKSVPTQVFYDRDGKEVFRHVGFFPKEQIVAKLVKIGVK